MLEIGPAARPGMDRNAGRLVDDQHQPVAIKHAVDQIRGQICGRVHRRNIVVTRPPRKRPRERDGIGAAIAAVPLPERDLVTGQADPLLECGHG